MVVAVPRARAERRRRWMHSQVRAPMTSAAAAMTPMATPALAPVERLLLLLPEPLWTTVTPEAVGVAAPVVVGAKREEEEEDAPMQ